MLAFSIVAFSLFALLALAVAGAPPRERRQEPRATLRARMTRRATR